MHRRPLGAPLGNGGTSPDGQGSGSALGSAEPEGSRVGSTGDRPDDRVIESEEECG